MAAPLTIQCVVCGKVETYPLWCRKSEELHDVHRAVHRCRTCAAPKPT